MDYGLLEQLKEAQRAKAASLRALVASAEMHIEEINKLNNKLNQAATCASKAKMIPEFAIEYSMAQIKVGSSLIQAVRINGEPVGTNTQTQAISIRNDIIGEVNSMVAVIKQYCDKKTKEAENEKKEAERIKQEYFNVLASYPSSLGEFGPVPIFPTIPAVVNVSI